MVISIGQESSRLWRGTQWQGAESLAAAHFLIPSVVVTVIPDAFHLQLLWRSYAICVFYFTILKRLSKDCLRGNTSHKCHQIEHNKNLGLGIDKERACTWFTTEIVYICIMVSNIVLTICSSVPKKLYVFFLSFIQPIFFIIIYSKFE